MSNAMVGAYKLGRESHRAGLRQADCPYDHKGNGFQKGFYRYWIEGWNNEEDGCDCENPAPYGYMTGVWHYSNDCPLHGVEQTLYRVQKIHFS